MKALNRRVAVVATAAALAGGAAGAWADTRYHIRPYYQIGFGEVIDGLKENSDTYGIQGFGDAARKGRAEVDIGTGTLRVYNELNVPDTGFVVALGEFSETFEIRGGIGTTFDFDFAVDGRVTADALSVAGNHYQFDVYANLAVFPVGVADWNTWYDLATTTNSELFYEQYNFRRVNPAEDVDETINELLSVSLPIGSNLAHFHVFARIQLAAVANSPQHVVLDFENTGELTFSAAPGVDVFSESGVFPGTLPVPEPGVIGFVVVAAGAARRRGRR